ncbi:hypothetical protein V5O48_016432 [Marasmius crinis-equi]|uniref:Uncharacterized protein n=1 Tax=Marasmius crinis-equi TaxID=585013 RepID=A0ABR3ERR2_9AGAR
MELSMGLRRSSRLLLRDTAEHFAKKFFPSIDEVAGLHKMKKKPFTGYTYSGTFSQLVERRHLHEEPELHNEDPAIVQAMNLDEELSDLTEMSEDGASTFDATTITGRKRKARTSDPDRASGQSDEEIRPVKHTDPAGRKGKLQEIKKVPMKHHRYEEPLQTTLDTLVPKASQEPDSDDPDRYAHLTPRQQYDRNHRLGRDAKRKKPRFVDLNQASEGFDDALSDSRICSTSWQGLNATDEERGVIQKAIQDGAKLPKPVVPIFYNSGRNVAVADAGGTLMFYRTCVNNFTEWIMGPLLMEIMWFMWLCTAQDLAVNKSRGTHWFCIAGIDRNCKSAPWYSEWHLANRHVIDDFFGPDRLFRRLTGFGCGILQNVFPEVANRYKRCIKYMKTRHNLTPQFGLFWNFCLNGISSATNVDRVHCLPHVDFKNIALGVCMIFIYGHFNYSETCWLVVWEAGVAFELPPGVFLLYPSSLFLHFNIDVANLDFVVTKDGKIPTRSNSEPLCSCSEDLNPECHGEDWRKAKGRGSMVWFNQASMFQMSELDEETGHSSVKAAKAAGAPSECNAEFWTKNGIFPVHLPKET